MAVRVGDFLYITVDWNQLLIMDHLIRIHNNHSMSSRWIGSDKITNECVVRVGYNHFISNKGEWNNN